MTLKAKDGELRIIRTDKRGIRRVCVPGLHPNVRAAFEAWRADQPKDPPPDELEPEPLIPHGKGLHVALAIWAAMADRPPLPPGQGLPPR